MDLPGGTSTLLPLLAHSTTKVSVAAGASMYTAAKRSMCALAKPSCSQPFSKLSSMGVGPQQ
ncbi:hypothetical protein D3C71_1835580 [compost metagenome]